VIFDHLSILAMSSALRVQVEQLSEGEGPRWMPANQGRGYAAGMSSPELSRRVDAHEEDLRAISDTAIEIRDDVAHIKTEHGRLLAEHSAALGEHGTKLNELGGKLDAVLTLLARARTADIKRHHRRLQLRVGEQLTGLFGRDQRAQQVVARGPAPFVEQLIHCTPPGGVRAHRSVARIPGMPGVSNPSAIGCGVDRPGTQGRRDELVGWGVPHTRRADVRFGALEHVDASVIVPSACRATFAGRGGHSCRTRALRARNSAPWSPVPAR
jgi:hypothetical protein